MEWWGHGLKAVRAVADTVETVSTVSETVETRDYRNFHRKMPMWQKNHYTHLNDRTEWRGRGRHGLQTVGTVSQKLSEISPKLYSSCDSFYSVTVPTVQLS